jgi:hypothetical protein
VTQLGPTAAVPYRAVKMRHGPSGAAEELLSWPSLGSFGHGALDALPVEAVAVAVAAKDAAAAAALTAAAAAPHGHDHDHGGAGADGLSEAVPGARLALSDPEAEEEDSDVTSTLPAFPAAVKATAPAASPFVAGPAPPLQYGIGGGGAADAAAAALAGTSDGTRVTAESDSPTQLRPGPAVATATLGVEAVAGGGDGGDGRLGPTAAVEAALSPRRRSASGPPVKIRRTGSGEIHYVAMQADG